MTDYAAAVAAAQAGGSAARDGWSMNKYIEELNGQLMLVMGTTVNPYSPSSEDEAAYDWWADGTDKPPKRT